MLHFSFLIRLILLQGWSTTQKNLIFFEPFIIDWKKALKREHIAIVLAKGWWLISVKLSQVKLSWWNSTHKAVHSHYDLPRSRWGGSATTKPKRKRPAPWSSWSLCSFLDQKNTRCVKGNRLRMTPLCRRKWNLICHFKMRFFRILCSFLCGTALGQEQTHLPGDVMVVSNNVHWPVFSFFNSPKVGTISS